MRQRTVVVGGTLAAALLAGGVAGLALSGGSDRPARLAADPTPTGSASPSETPTPTPTPTPSATTPPPRPATSPPATSVSPTPAPDDCLPRNVSARMTSRQESYAWRSETVYLDVTVTNTGPACVWFTGIGYVFDNEHPAAGANVEQCIRFVGERRDVFAPGATRKWTLAWDQRCGAPDSASRRDQVGPGGFRVSLQAVWKDGRCEPGRECSNTGYDALIASVRFSLVDESSPSPSPTLLAP